VSFRVCFVGGGDPTEWTKTIRLLSADTKTVLETMTTSTGVAGRRTNQTAFSPTVSLLAAVTSEGNGVVYEGGISDAFRMLTINSHSERVVRVKS
jgi:hypothetical protein